jgi:hypothetical protein
MRSSNRASKRTKRYKRGKIMIYAILSVKQLTRNFIGEIFKPILNENSGFLKKWHEMRGHFVNKTIISIRRLFGPNVRMAVG